MKLDNTMTFAAPAEVVWQVLGEEFGSIHTWASTLATSELFGDLGVGAVRVCEGTGFGPFPPGEVREVLTQFDRETMQFTYRAEKGLPAFVTYAENHWTVVADGPDQSIVTSQATVQLAWWARPMQWLMPWATRGAMQQFTDDLRHRVEGGVTRASALAS